MTPKAIVNEVFHDNYVDKCKSVLIITNVVVLRLRRIPLYHICVRWSIMVVQLSMCFGTVFNVALSVSFSRETYDFVSRPPCTYVVYTYRYKLNIYRAGRERERDAGHCVLSAAASDLSS